MKKFLAILRLIIFVVLIGLVIFFIYKIFTKSKADNASSDPGTSISSSTTVTDQSGTSAGDSSSSSDSTGDSSQNDSSEPADQSEDANSDAASDSNSDKSNESSSESSSTNADSGSSSDNKSSSSSSKDSSPSAGISSIGFITLSLLVSSIAYGLVLRIVTNKA